jgi:general secretion pathway protein C
VLVWLQAARHEALQPGGGQTGADHHNLRMKTRWWTFAVWAVAAGSALFWALKLFVAPLPVPPRTPVAAQTPAARGDLTRLLGVDAPAPVMATVNTEPPPDARFQLVGVLSPRSKQAASEGLALIAVDGKPAKAFRVGAVIDGQTVLQSVGARGAQLGPRGGAVLVALNLAAPAAAATGTLPGLGAGGQTPGFPGAGAGAGNPPGSAPAVTPTITPASTPAYLPYAGLNPPPNAAPKPTPNNQSVTNTPPNRRALPPPALGVPVTQPFMAPNPGAPNRFPGQGPGDLPTQ